MKFLLLASCIIGMALCAPPQMYKEFDIHYAPVEAAPAIPAGAALGTLDVLLPVDNQRLLVGGPVRGFIKQEIPKANGEHEDVYYPFGFNVPDPAVAAPAAPVVVAAPAAPAVVAVPAAPAVVAVPAAPAVVAVPVAPAAPAAPVVAAAKPKDEDEEEEEDD